MNLVACRRPALRYLALFAACAAPVCASDEMFEGQPIRYSASVAQDPVSALERRMAENGFDFERAGGEKAYLQSVLEALGVSPSSQLLVFSKTSVQASRITPEHPRALYFSDDCYVGWVPGGDVEVASFDPQLGVVFYRLHVPHDAAERTRVDRDVDCLRCHVGLSRDRTPALLVRSVVPDPLGEPVQSSGTHFTDFRSPLKERWGGWYVTGQHGAMRHMGNVMADPAAGASPVLDMELGANQARLPARVDRDQYLHAGSDVATLMIFEHQVTVHNAILSAHYAARQTIYRNAELATILNYPTNQLSETNRRLLADLADRLVQTLLCCGEFQMTDDGVKVDPAFAEVYARGARRASDGRSLRDLQLLTRIYKHRCSPLIYSTAFASLPPVFRALVLDRIHAVLAGSITSSEDQERYAHLGADERLRIREILLETLPDLPRSWTRGLGRATAAR